MKLREKLEDSLERGYDKAEWEKLQKKDAPAFVIRKGRELGVPKDEINRFAEEVIGRAVGNNEYAFVYRFMTSLGIGKNETARSIGGQGYQFLMKIKDFGSAMGLAEDLYGKDSDEWKRANSESEKVWEKIKLNKAKKEKEGEVDSFVTLSEDATFADLFKAVENHKESEGLDNYFVQELWDNFSSEIAEEVLDFRDRQIGEGAVTKILDFFKERGYSRDEVSTFLPVKFKKREKIIS